MSNIYDILEERGFISQVTDQAALKKLLASETITCYIGFDPTAPSLHVGSLLPLMALAHMRNAGHRPIAILGGGTAMIGDPSGKTEMRKMLSEDTIRENGKQLSEQIRKFIGKDGEVIDNANWLLDLSYIAFLRDIGRHFSVNRMLSFESYKIRLEKGLSFLEFNYQLLQAYDFLVLFREHDCKLQMGGDDQWGNIVAGMDLIRRVESKPAYGLTLPLLQTASGEKMGKTAGGAVWLSGVQTKPYDFYQYFRNVDDRDVERFLGFFTFLPMEQVRELGQKQDAELNSAKEVLAHEVTAIVHGQEAADQARAAAQSVFGGQNAGAQGIPTTEISQDRLSQGVLLVDLYAEVGLCKSKSEARRLITQGGARIEDRRVGDINDKLTIEDLTDGTVLIRAGKKKVHRISKK
ncbi:MAG: tyrosine--tRNA ligase [Deltaproteobacteria bacterium]|nr:tyrosine--tRNA ligase [Deltaproteobacteria bacterium]MBW1870513.1 tyrosine--tRNA ligase [Deltaproteobacteria bacterium]